MELSSAKEIYVGGKKAAEIYIGGKLVWPLYKESDTWENMEWNGQTNIYARYVWTDGEKIYYSSGTSSHWELDVATHTWIKKTWNGRLVFIERLNDDAPSGWVLASNAQDVWSDGDNVYLSTVYSGWPVHAILDASTSTWTNVTFSGLPDDLRGAYVWRSGDDVYYSNGDTHYAYNKSNRSWSEKSFGLRFSVNDICKIGDRTMLQTDAGWYEYSQSDKQFHGVTFSYADGVVAGAITPICVWGDGKHTYFSNLGENYKLNVMSWEQKTWNGLSNFQGESVWCDGVDTYYSSGGTQKRLVKK